MQYVIVYFTLYTIHQSVNCVYSVVLWQCGPLTELDKGIVARDKGSFSIDTGVAGILTNKFTFLWETVEEEGGGDSKAFNTMAAAAAFCFLLCIILQFSFKGLQEFGVWSDARDALENHYTRAQVAVWHDRDAFANCPSWNAAAVVRECLNKKACRKFCQNPK